MWAASPSDGQPRHLACSISATLLGTCRANRSVASGSTARHWPRLGPECHPKAPAFRRGGGIQLARFGRPRLRFWHSLCGGAWAPRLQPFLVLRGSGSSGRSVWVSGASSELRECPRLPICGDCIPRRARRTHRRWPRHRFLLALVSGAVFCPDSSHRGRPAQRVTPPFPAGRLGAGV